jgi:dethiobiotin synthetase
MIGYFVSGTDTGVGKSVVSAALLASAIARGRRARACKPVESGCAEVDGRPHPADGELLRRAAGGRDPLEDVVALALRAPRAPLHAARREGRTVDVDGLVRFVRRAIDAVPDLLVVEGAGGLRVPLSSDREVVDLAAAIGLPLILVARAALGTINHTSLSLECAARRGLVVRGVILSDAGPAPTPPDDVAENVAAIARAGGEVLGVLPPLGTLDGSPASLARLADAAARHLPLDRLL